MQLDNQEALSVLINGVLALCNRYQQTGFKMYVGRSRRIPSIGECYGVRLHSACHSFAWVVMWLHHAAMRSVAPVRSFHTIMGNRCGTTLTDDRDDRDDLSRELDGPPEYTTAESTRTRMDVAFDKLCERYERCLHIGEEFPPWMMQALIGLYELKFNTSFRFCAEDLTICVLRYLDARENGGSYRHKTAAELKTKTAIECGQSTPV